MCLAIPMRITEIEGAMALTELDGVTRRASIMLVPHATVGDYVLVHAGCAITVLERSEAEETLRLLGEIAAFEAEVSGDTAGVDEAGVDEAGVDEAGVDQAGDEVEGGRSPRDPSDARSGADAGDVGS